VKFLTGDGFRFVGAADLIGMSSPPVVQYASRTDVGMRRAANQDSMAVRLCNEYDEWSRCGHLFVVADGMGGHAVGDLASRITVDTLPHVYFKRNSESVELRLKESIEAANKAVNDRGRENREFEGMGTTCSVLSLSDRGALVGHVGDSRVYRIRGGWIEQLTFDHSLQWEMIRLGRATAENVELFHPRNVITRCLGPDPAVIVDVEGPFSVRSGDAFLLCSDGLTNHVTDSEIGQIVSSLPPAESSRLLINLANLRGGSDNCTVVVVAVDSYPPTTADTIAVSGTKYPGAESQRKRKPLESSDRSNTRRVLLLLLALLLLAGGIAAAVAGRQLPAAGLVAASVFGWLLSHRVSGATLNGKDPGAVPANVDGNRMAATDPWVATPTLQPESEDSESSRSAFQTKSPYRVVSAQLSQKFVSHLAAVQGELVQAARESSWKVDFDELTDLSRQAVQAEQSNRLDKALKSRSKAIELLMRELYHRSRST
jgi:protein phosphatase